MPTTEAWQPLTIEYKVAVVAGGMPFEHRDTDEDVAKYESFLREKFGLTNPHPEVFLTEKNYCGMSDRPEVRAEFIAKTLADPQVKVMFDCGGNGSDEVIEYLKKMKLEMRPDMLMVAVSDGQQLLNYLGQIGAVSPVEGAPLGMLCADEKAAEEMRKFLFEQKIDPIGLQCFNDAARSAGSVDGKLTMFNGHTRRSDYSTVIDEGYGSILLLEATTTSTNSKMDVVEGLQFALDAMKQQKQKPRAILLSQSDLLCSTEKIEQIKKLAAESDIPIFSGAPFGHARGIKHVPLPLHTDVRLSIDGEKATMSVSAVRTLEDVESVKKFCESRKPYSVEPASISENVITVPDLTVVRVYDSSEEKKKSRSHPVRPTTQQGDKRSWVDVVKGVTEVTDSQEFLLVQATRICRRLEATDLDGVDLSGKNVAIDIGGCDNFEDWKKRKENESKTEEDFSKESLSNMRQDVQTVLMELLKTGQLQTAESLTFLLHGEAPKGFGDWLADFAKGHELNPKIFLCQAGKETAEIFPDGPPKAKGEVSVIKAKMKVVERSESEEVGRF